MNAPIPQDRYARLVQSISHILRNRDNRTARGMTVTINLCGHSRRLSDEARTLSVMGTLDRLANGLLFHVKAERVKCQCCGHYGRGKMKLTDWGRSRLRRARRIAAERAQRAAAVL